ncbi:MAG: prephenate dehydrogenase/arogenate dehydrogenase family protein [Gammaproteobacteria bacterium]|nr:prephenate dehydrogenase/arogenate dehydrogenase family protein [Gammaproteobacteria bacterium]
MTVSALSIKKSDNCSVDTLCIIGVGLIGGSLARGLKSVGFCRQVVGYSRQPQALRDALELGAIDRAASDVGDAVSGADLVVVAVPVGAMEAIFRQINGYLAAHTVVTDVGSTKGSVVNAARAAFGELPSHLVPAHPIAGAEKSGVKHSQIALFEGHNVIMTPLAETEPDAVALVRAMWQSVGARVSEMSVADHDSILAATSHLPHLLAYLLVGTLSRMDQSEAIFDYAAGGFRDFTRIASSDPVMWRDISLANRDAIIAVAERFEGELTRLKAAIRDEDAAYVENLYSAAKAARDRSILKSDQ